MPINVCFRQKRLSLSILSSWIACLLSVLCFPCWIFTTNVNITKRNAIRPQNHHRHKRINIVPVAIQDSFDAGNLAIQQVSCYNVLIRLRLKLIFPETVFTHVGRHSRRRANLKLTRI